MDHKAAAGRRHATMKRQLFVWLALFTAFVIALLWLFQIVLLERIYKGVLLMQLRSGVEMIAGNADSDALQTLCDRVSQEHGFCVSVWRIHNRRGTLDASSHIRDDCLLHRFGSDEINRLYAAASYTDGISTEYFTLSAFRNNSYNDDYFTGNAPGNDSGLSDSVFVMKVVDLPGGDKAFVILNTTMAPVSSTAQTLRLQLAFITAILLVAALLLAGFISKKLSTPLARMNASAKALARGDYNVRFAGEGCRETEELGDTLNYAAVELGSLDRLQKELIANISHDLRTPLTMIRGYAELMRDIPDEMTAENMQIIIDETLRLSSLVSDIMDISKLENGEQTLHTETFELSGTISETMERYKKLTERDGYDIRFVCEDSVSPCYVSADRTRILQVVYNLINNAINYTGDDKTVTVRLLRAVRDGAELARVEVADTGEGIAPENLSKIWDRYYRVDRVHKRAAVGTGLGLSIVKSVLVLHNAPFGVESKVGEGSTFWFELPVAYINSDAIEGER